MTSHSSLQRSASTPEAVPGVVHARPHLLLLAADQTEVGAAPPALPRAAALLHQLDTAAGCQLFLLAHPVQPRPHMEATAAALRAGRPVAPVSDGTLSRYLLLHLVAVELLTLAPLFADGVNVRTFLTTQSVEKPPGPSPEAGSAEDGAGRPVGPLRGAAGVVW